MTVKPSELSAALDQAQEAIGKLDYSKANQLLEEAIRARSEAGPEVEMARLLLAETSLVVGRWERAQRELDRLTTVIAGIDPPAP